MEPKSYRLQVGGVAVRATVRPAPKAHRYAVCLEADTASLFAHREDVLGLVRRLAGSWAAAAIDPLLPSAPPARPWRRSLFFGAATVAVGPETTAVEIASIDYATVAEQLLAYEVP